MVKKTSANIITTPHASYHIVLTKIPGQGFGYETDYVDDKKHSFPFFLSSSIQLYTLFKTQEPQTMPISAAHSLIRRKRELSPR